MIDANDGGGEMKVAKKLYNDRSNAGVFRDANGVFTPTRVEDEWEPLKKGVIQHRIEKDIERAVKSLFVHGRPAPGTEECRYVISWKRGIFRFYVNERVFCSVTGPMLLAIRKVLRRYPNMKLQMFLVNHNTTFPFTQQSFDLSKDKG